MQSKVPSLLDQLQDRLNKVCHLAKQGTLSAGPATTQTEQGLSPCKARYPLCWTSYKTDWTRFVTLQSKVPSLLDQLQHRLNKVCHLAKQGTLSAGPATRQTEQGLSPCKARYPLCWTSYNTDWTRFVTLQSKVPSLLDQLQDRLNKVCHLAKQGTLSAGPATTQTEQGLSPCKARYPLCWTSYKTDWTRFVTLQSKVPSLLDQLQHRLNKVCHLAKQGTLSAGPATTQTEQGLSPCKARYPLCWTSYNTDWTRFVTLQSKVPSLLDQLQDRLNKVCHLAKQGTLSAGPATRQTEQDSSPCVARYTPPHPPHFRGNPLAWQGIPPPPFPCWNTDWTRFVTLHSKVPPLLDQLQDRLNKVCHLAKQGTLSAGPATRQTEQGLSPCKARYPLCWTSYNTDWTRFVTLQSKVPPLLDQLQDRQNKVCHLAKQGTLSAGPATTQTEQGLSPCIARYPLCWTSYKTDWTRFVTLHSKVPPLLDQLQHRLNKVCHLAKQGTPSAGPATRQTEQGLSPCKARYPLCWTSYNTDRTRFVTLHSKVPSLLDQLQDRLNKVCHLAKQGTLSAGPATTQTEQGLSPCIARYPLCWTSYKTDWTRFVTLQSKVPSLLDQLQHRQNKVCHLA